MDGRSDRRGFFRAALAQIAAGAEEAGLGLPQVLRDAPSGEPEPAAPEAPAARVAATVPVQPAARCASMDDLMRLAAEVGLTTRSADVRSLARPSARLIAGDATGPSAADGSLTAGPELPPGVAAPVRDGRPLTPLVQLDLADASARGLGSLPAEGRLLFFYDTVGMPTGVLGEHADGACVLLAPPAPEAAPGTTVGRMTGGVFGELALPRVWSAPVQELGLDADERDAWERLRQALADHQGVELDEGAAPDRALHRVLGYPDERRGTMPLLCELLARGHDVPTGYPDANAAGGDAQARSHRWRLLLALSGDDRLGWSWGGTRTRLYFWWDEDGPRTHGLPPVWAVRQ